jgi:Tfp pilus assembly protein PilF
MRMFKHQTLLALLATSTLVAAGCKTTGGAGPKLSKEEQAEVDAAAEEGVTTKKAAGHFKKSVALLQKDNGSGAKQQLEMAFEADPTFAVAKYNLGVIAEKEQKYEEAAEHYRAAFDTDQCMDLGINNLGLILESRGQEREARVLYTEAIDKCPETVYPRIRLAKLAHRDNDPKTAVKLAREALQFDAKSLEAYRLLARLYAENKKNQLARLIALRGSKLSQDDPELTYALAVVAMNDKNVAAARELLNKVIELNPEHIDARMRLATMALAVRDWKTAEPQLVELLKHDPNNLGLMTNLGLAYKGQGRFDEAQKSYEAALAKNDPSAAINLAILELRNLDKPEDAEQHLEQYLSYGGDGSRARPLIEEARTLIEAKREEARMMEEMKRQEEEAAAQAAEEAKRAEAEAKRQAEEDAAARARGEPTKAEREAADAEAAAQAEAQAIAEAEAEAARIAAEEEAKKKKRKKRKKKKKKKKKKDAAPGGDDDFFE